MRIIAASLFWIALAFLVYAYGGFVLVVAAIGRWRKRRVRTAEISPHVSLIIAAYNEAAVIGERLENVLRLDYPRDRLQVIVAADGCSDDTEATVRRYQDRGVVLLSLPRRGKIPTLNAAAGRAVGEILVFSDANTMCEPQALRALVRNFADAEVGGVAGLTSYALAAGTESSGRGERLYWDYDTWLKRLESDAGSVVSAHGGLYAVRRSLFQPIRDFAVTDDFAISTAVVEQGYRLVFEPSARAVEFAVPEAAREFRRRVRLMTRGLRSVLLRRRLLNPWRYGFYSLVLFSHKVARRLAPIALLVLAATSVRLADGDQLFLAVVICQSVFYGLAVAGWALRRARIGGSKALYIPFFYCMANAASAVALFDLTRGKRIALWKPQRHSVS
jgi:cellulose synthase/poly-beta-1,6-N-acetylglucosamine synthase-like glycosyltransferase